MCSSGRLVSVIAGNLGRLGEKLLLEEPVWMYFSPGVLEELEDLLCSYH